MGYRLPEYNSVRDEDLIWHAAKLSEETGEVCQILCKRGSLQDAALECIDVIQCAENILRKIGITGSRLDKMYENHVSKDEERGYLRKSGMLL